MLSSLKILAAVSILVCPLWRCSAAAEGTGAVCEQEPSPACCHHCAKHAPQESSPEAPERDELPCRDGCDCFCKGAVTEQDAYDADLLAVPDIADCCLLAESLSDEVISLARVDHHRHRPPDSGRHRCALFCTYRL